MIVVADGGREQPVACIGTIPLTMQGRVRFQVENVLAAVGAAYALGVSTTVISPRAAGFAANLDSDPTRFNVFSYRGATVVVDFGHNADALSSVIQALDSFPEARRTAVFSSSGDRRDEDILCMGELLGAAFDRVVLYEDTDLYARRPGEIIGLLKAGMARSGRVRRIDEFQGGLNALRHALETVGPGELLMAQAHLADPTAEYLRTLDAPLVPLS
jgi:cyanophycin synthetase